MTVSRGHAGELIAAARRRVPSDGPVDDAQVDARLRAVFLRAALGRARRRLPVSRPAKKPEESV